MPEINRLSPSQVARFAEFRDKWTAIGLSTAPANRPEAEAAIIEMYRVAGLAPPLKIVWCGSPLSQGLTRAIILDKKMGASVKDSVWDSVWDSVGDSVGASAGDSVGASVWASVYGQHDASWLAFYDYFNEVCGLSAETANLSGLWHLARSAGWALPHKNMCWVSERHHVLERDERGRLHNLAGPAISYPDGWNIYAVHGVRVPAWIIERPKTITAKKIDAEKNAEIRRVMIDQMGASIYIRESGAKLIHSDECGKLWRKDLPGDEPIQMIEVVNSTAEPTGESKTYWLRVPPTIRTAHEGAAWTFGLDAKSYHPQIET